MANNNDKTQSGLPSSTGIAPSREADENKLEGSGKKTGTQGDTAGGREGNFSDRDREKDGEWSPGSLQASDQ